MELYNVRYDRKIPRKNRSKKFVASIYLTVLMLISSGGYVTAAATKDYQLQAPVTIEYSYTPSEVSISWPKTGQAAFGTLDKGKIDVSSNEKVQPMASITKLVTALTILKKDQMKKGEVGPIYTMDSNDVRIYNNYVNIYGSVVPVSLGLKLSQYDMLNGLLLPSGNNMADSLVAKHYSSFEEYLKDANTLVSYLGMKNTVIYDASGFSPKTTSTPSDLIILAQAALSNEVIAEIMSKTSYNFPGYGKIINSNRLLGVRDGIIGLKTGTTNEAGYCLLFAENYKEGDHTTTIIGVILGDISVTNLYSNAQLLLNSVEKGFGLIEVVPAGSIVATLDSSWGNSTNFYTDKSLTTYGWKGDKYNTDIEIKTPPLAIEANEGVGDMQIVGTEDSAVVKAESSIDQPGIWWRLQNVF